MESRFLFNVFNGGAGGYEQTHERYETVCRERIQLVAVVATD